MGSDVGNKMTLNEKMQEKSTNVNLIRFFAAAGVLVSHAHVLSDGSQDWLCRLTGVTWGALAVGFFFFVSGLYVSKSLVRCQKGSKYFAARIKRLIPLLAVVILVTVFLLGPWMSTLGAGEYFRNVSTWKYLANIFLIPVHNLPGVFETGNISSTVNGSLWTLPVEFLCYMILFAAFKMKLLQKDKKAIWGFGIMLVSIVSYWLGNRLSSSMILSASQAVILFFMGAFYYVIKDMLVLDVRMGVLAILGWTAFSCLGISFFGNILFLPVIITVFLIGTKQVFPRASELGNLSYAIYLTAFPVQQIVIAMNGGMMDPYGNMVLSIPFVMVISYGLYGLENIFLNRKRKG